MKGAAVLRKSQGSDDDISLEIQREKVPEALESHGCTDIDIYDLGVHTGFSFHTKPEAEERIDNNTQMQELLERLKDGEYGVLGAYDYTRICRDDYFSRFKGAAIQGEAEFVFVEGDEEVGSLSEDIRRNVEKHVKKTEIEKSREAIQRKKDAGEPLGRAPYGLKHNEDSTRLVPSENFDIVEEIIRRREEEDASYTDIEEDTGVSRSTAHKICTQHMDKYREHLPGDLI